MNILIIAIGFLMIGAILVGVAKFIENNKTNDVAEPAEIDMPYIANEPFFNRSELEFFRILNSQLDAHRYTLFPKVRLADFVKVAGGNNSDVASWNRIKSKHVDYLVWDLTKSKIILAIELDGKSHNSAMATKKDKFKDEMYAGIGLHLERVRVGDDFAGEAKRIAETLV
jgi:hypothetical protein